jgi:hypothetical protein
MSTNIETIACNVLSNYPVKRAALFGSAARDDLGENSDVDILVEFLPDTRGLEFFGLRVDLEEALGRTVDLVTFNTLTKSKPEFKKHVEQEIRLIFEYHDV